MCLEAALSFITTVMEEQHLLLDVVEFPLADGKVKWALYMDGDAVFRGEAHSKWEVLCADFFTQRLALLKLMPS